MTRLRWWQLAMLTTHSFRLSTDKAANARKELWRLWYKAQGMVQVIQVDDEEEGDYEVCYVPEQSSSEPKLIARTGLPPNLFSLATCHPTRSG